MKGEVPGLPGQPELPSHDQTLQEASIEEGQSVCQRIPDVDTSLSGEWIIFDQGGRTHRYLFVSPTLFAYDEDGRVRYVGSGPHRKRHGFVF